MPHWARRAGNGWLIAVHVQPGAKKSEIAGLHGEALKVRIAAPAVDDKANLALLAFIAERVGVARSKVRLLRGERSREKQIEILAADVDVERLLAPASGQ